MDAGRAPRVGLVLGAVPLALLFGALAGYAASPTTPALAPHLRSGQESAAVGAWLHLVTDAPQPAAPGTPAPLAMLTGPPPAPDPARPAERAERLERSAHLQLVVAPSAAAASTTRDEPKLHLLQQSAGEVRQADPAP
ncbi:hypothetical protein GTQ99_04540 [Kineococcus sp. T13]|uniref:hypothetical protein n=1 Tax=Kineococcus vitellinus TaxID=2696565 RepID=UPI001412B897|nr:hypothetical protein [Kineococcus vitellinus]NAZ74692.1 hypothetical protein [Kineococcus vitellinus]